MIFLLPEAAGKATAGDKLAIAINLEQSPPKPPPFLEAEMLPNESLAPAGSPLLDPPS